MIDVGERYFTCDECGICSGIQTRLSICDEYGRFQFDHCACDKIGYDFYVGGYCEDAFIDKQPHSKKGERKTGRAYRREQDAKKHKRRMQIINQGGYNPYAGYIEYDWIDGKWQQTGNHIKYPNNSNLKVYLKNQSNRKVRRYKDSLPSGNSYRKLYEYWWTLF